MLMALFLIHCFVPKSQMTSGKRQGNLITIIVTLDGAVLMIWLAVSLFNGEPWPLFFPPLLYVLAVFNSAAYSYFHLFNMSETARRIRILRDISARSGLSTSDLAHNYSPRGMLEARIDRLMDLGEIEIDSDGRIRLKKRRLILAAYIFSGLRKILIGRNGTESIRFSPR